MRFSFFVRRASLAALAACCLLGAPIVVADDAAVPAPAAPVSPVRPTSNVQPAFERLPLGSIKARGWVAQQLRRSKDGMGGRLDELEPDMIGKPYVTREYEMKVSPGWNGEISGTYWAGLVQLAYTLDDAELKAKAERWVRAFLALQEDDGYLGSYRPEDNRLEDYSAWSANWGYRALLAYYEATGDPEVLEAVRRGTLWYVDHWSGAQKTNYAGPTLIESAIDVWRLTGDERLANWAVEYLDWLDQNDAFWHGRAALSRPKLRFNEDHVVAFGENVKNPALVYLYTGAAADLNASVNGVEQVRARCWQINGAPASNGEHHAPPAAHHVTEYCNFPTWQNTFLRLAAITGDAKYGDLAERVLFNGGEGARKKDERAIVYFSSPNQFLATFESELFLTETFGVYAPNFHVACCPVQSVRLVPEYVRSAAAVDANGDLVVPVYCPCEIRLPGANGSDADAAPATLTEETNYPFDLNATFRFATATPWEKSLRLRVPEWSEGFEARRGGEIVEPERVADGWATFAGPWNDGDSLEISFQATPKIVAVDDVYFKAEPLRSVEYGPLLFALRYDVEWKPIPGSPLTPLPEDWSWFDAVCAGDPGFFAIPDVALDGREKIRVNRQEIGDDYPWENPPLTLSVPLIRTQKHAWPYSAYHFKQLHHNLMPYGNPVDPDDGAKVESAELVPYGATNLRLTCFPVAETNEENAAASENDAESGK